MKVVLTGCKGQLGQELLKQFMQSGTEHTIVETDIHNLDIANSTTVFELIRQEKPQAIINCAAYTNVDNCETDSLNAFRINSIGARNLSAAAYAVGAKIVQISTDYVFDGEKNIAIREYDTSNPQSVYGQSKLLGENLVRETNPKHYILRTSWLFGDGNNFVRTMLRLAKEQKELNVVSDQIGSPTSTVDLARCIISLINEDSYGTYHATGEGSCSWFEFAKKIFELSGISVKVNGVTTEQFKRAAKRPKFSVLDNFMLNLIGQNNFRYWEETLKEYLKCENELR